MANVFEMMFKVVDKATRPIRKVMKATAGPRTGLLKVGKIATKGLVIGAVAGFLSLSTILTASVSKAIAFESAMSDVKKVVDFDSPQGFKDMGRDIIDLSRRIPLAASAISEIVAAAAQSKVAKSDLLKFAEGAAKVSVAFDMAAGSVSENLAKIKTNLSLTVDETFAFADTLNMLSNNQAATAAQLLVFSRNTVSLGTANGFTANQVAALGAAMIGTGAEADVAKTSFNNMVRALTKGEAATKANRIAFKRLGMDAKTVSKTMQTDAIGTLQKVFDKIRQLPKEVQAATISQLFGNEARALMPLINNVDVLNDALKNIADTSKFVGKSVENEFKARAATTANNMQLMKNNIDALGIAVGSRLLPPINDGLKAVNDFLSTLGDGTSSIEIALASVTKFYKDFTSGFSSSFDGIREKFSGVTTAFSNLGETIGKIFGLLTGQSETFGSTFGKLVGGAFEIILTVLEAVVKTLDWVLGGLLFVAKAVSNFSWDDLVPDLPDMPDFSAWTKPVTDFMATIKGNLSGINWFALVPDLPEMPDLAKWKNRILDLMSFQWLPEIKWPALPKLELPNDMFAGVTAAMQTPFTGAFTAISEVWEKIKTLFDWSPLAAIKERFGPIVDTISGFISGAADKAGAAWNRLTNIFSNEEPVKLAVNDPASFERATKAANALNTVLGQITGVAAKATAILNSANFSNQGKRMMDTLAAGMKARAFVVVDQIKATMKDVRKYLPSSPAKVGPLSDIHKLKFGETIAKSIKSDPMVKAMRAATLATRAAANDNQFSALSRVELSRGSITQSNIKAQARRSASNSARGTVINYAPSITIEGGGPDAEKRFKELLKQHPREIKKIVDEENNRVARRSYG